MYTYFAIHIYISFNLNKTISYETLKFKILFLQIAISCLQKKTFPIFSIYSIQRFSQFVSIIASVYKKIYSYYFANIVLTLSTYTFVHKFLPYHQIFTKLKHLIYFNIYTVNSIEMHIYFHYLYLNKFHYPQIHMYHVYTWFIIMYIQMYHVSTNTNFTIHKYICIMWFIIHMYTCFSFSLLGNLSHSTTHKQSFIHILSPSPSLESSNK